MTGDLATPHSNRHHLHVPSQLAAHITRIEDAAPVPEKRRRKTGNPPVVARHLPNRAWNRTPDNPPPIDGSPTLTHASALRRVAARWCCGRSGRHRFSFVFSALWRGGNRDAPNRTHTQRGRRRPTADCFPVLQFGDQKDVAPARRRGAREGGEGGRRS